MTNATDSAMSSPRARSVSSDLTTTVQNSTTTERSPRMAGSVPPGGSPAPVPDASPARGMPTDVARTGSSPARQSRPRSSISHNILASVSHVAESFTKTVRNPWSRSTSRAGSESGDWDESRDGNSPSSMSNRATRFGVRFRASTAPANDHRNSEDMDDLEEEDESQMLEMMNSLERRQTTDPRKLALAMVGRESRRALKSQGVTVGTTGQVQYGTAWAKDGRFKESQRMVFMNAKDDEEFQEALKSFANNSVKTAKYNPFSFLPLFLFEMFSRAAYFYFLCQACLSWWEVVAPLGGAGATMALMFVLGVSGVKAVAEDMKRHTEDKKTNTSTTHIMDGDGSLRDVQWQDVQVGDIVMVKDGELIPADLLCLHVALADGVCFIKTTNLDGESNLKIRRPVQIEMDSLLEKGPQGLLSMKGVLECDTPNADLHTFRGCFSCAEGEDANAPTASFPVTMNEVLLRGCMLKNSGSIYGLVIYTGDDTRIQKNAAKTPFKVGAYDTFLNLQISVLMGLQAVLCIFGSLMATIWRNEQGMKRYHLGTNDWVQGNYENSAVFALVTLLTYWIILSYMVPISLFVTMEIVKFWQGFMFINGDPFMVDPETMEGAKCRNSNLMEDLGKVEYVFSDKTGTLTSNEMRLRQISVKGTIFGSTDVHLENNPDTSWEKCMGLFDKRMVAPMHWLQKRSMYNDIIRKGGSSHGFLKASSRGSLHSLNQSLQTSMENEAPGPWLANAGGKSNLHPPPHSKKNTALPPLGQQGHQSPPAVLTAAIHRLEVDILSSNEDGIVGLQLVDFWLNICVCQSLLVETGPDGDFVYQGPSPDEIALVDTARLLGFVFKHRDVNSVHLEFQGVPIKFDLLNVIEFSSERQRMSVVARCPDGTIRLFCKGADNAVLQRLSPGQEQETLANADRHLRLFAQQGLRTLCLGTKVIPMGAYREWDDRFQEVCSLLDGREEQMAQLQDEVEQDLELVGITAIEDKLQNGVPEAIASLLEAGVRVWMITGDKQETAINIATSCKLLKHPERAMVCNSESYLACKARLKELLAQVNPGLMDLGSITSPKDLIRPMSERMRARSQEHELVIDGQTLTHILGTNLESMLSELGSHCSSVVVCRASPSQKACIVKLMKEHELKLAVGTTTGIFAWKRKFEKRVTGKMLGIGDGANDVAMIQEADLGIGIMGKEGRQAVNNSDFAFTQFRHLVRLMLVHGQVSDYRLSNLIIYSFYKNMCFATVLFSFQFFCGYSGQTLVDDISAAGFNVIFTSLPVMIFSVLDRQVTDTTYLAYPQTYNKQRFLGTLSFWRRGVFHGIMDGAICFGVPYLSSNLTDARSVAGLYCLGKTCFLAMLGSVTLEIALLTNFWTRPAVGVIALSYLLSYVFITLYPAIMRLANLPDPAQQGVSEAILPSPTFWLSLMAANFTTFGVRVFVVWVKSLKSPSDADILAAREKLDSPWADISWQTRQRLAGLGMWLVDGKGDADPGDREQLEKGKGKKPAPTVSVGWGGGGGRDTGQGEGSTSTVPEAEMHRTSSKTPLVPRPK